MKGLVFDIQRFSVHDGPGIRTTVFMKGCSLKCLWCHNPEGLIGKPQLQFFEEKCIGCGRCEKRTDLSDAKKCPIGALQICGSWVSEEEVVHEVLKDCNFYGIDGGITFSGGECLLQAEFVAQVLKRVKLEGISTAIDTAGNIPWESVERVLPYCDLFLYDIKMMDGMRHKKYTGADNRLILENLRRLSDAKKKLMDSGSGHTGGK